MVLQYLYPINAQVLNIELISKAGYHGQYRFPVISDQFLVINSPHSQQRLVLSHNLIQRK